MEHKKEKSDGKQYETKNTIQSSIKIDKSNRINSENLQSGKRKADIKHKKPPNIEKKNANLDSFVTFLNLNNKPPIIQKDINEPKNYQIVEMGKSEERLMKCFNYISSHGDLREYDIILIENSIKFEIIKLHPIIIEINQEEFIFHKNSRELIFVDDRIIYKRFIYCRKNFLDVLKELGFKSFYTRSKKINKDNIEEIFDEKENELIADGSEISIDDPSIIFIDKTINIIYKQNKRPILRKENYNKRFNREIKYLKDLNQNSEYYYGENRNEKFFELNEYINASLNISTFFDSTFGKILYMFGPKGCSKTTFLLYLINTLRGIDEGILYINYNYIKNRIFSELKKIIYHEILYFCQNIEEMNKIEEYKIFKGIEINENKMSIIYQLLVNLFDAIAIDNHDVESFNRIIIIDNNYKLIICGRGKYFNNKFIAKYKEAKIYINEKIYNYINNEYMYIFSTNFNEDSITENSINNLEESIIDEEITELDNYSFFPLFFSEELHDRFLPFEEVINDDNLLKDMPLEFFKMAFEKNGIRFSFFNEIFKISIKNKIEDKVEHGALIYLLRSKNYPRTVFGVCFEKLIILLLKNNQLNLNNLNFEKKNIKEISEIVQFKEKGINFDSIFKDVNKDKPILLIQKNFFGALYDLIIIIKYNDLLYCNLLKIGVDKNISQISEILNDQKENNMTYLNNISKSFNINLNNISLVFIFDLEKQVETNFSSGVKYCEQMGIKYYLFSFKQGNLCLYDEESKSVTMVEKYIPFYTKIECKNTIKSDVKINKKGSSGKKEDKNEKLDKYFHKYY